MLQYLYINFLKAGQNKERVKICKAFDTRERISKNNCVFFAGRKGQNFALLRIVADYQDIHSLFFAKIGLLVDGKFCNFKLFSKINL